MVCIGIYAQLYEIDIFMLSFVVLYTTSLFLSFVFTLHLNTVKVDKTLLMLYRYSLVIKWTRTETGSIIINYIVIEKCTCIDQ